MRIPTLLRALGAVLACLVATSSLSATPSDNAVTWSWGGLYVDVYREYWEVSVSFKTSQGEPFTRWADRNGTNQCPNDARLRIHPQHPRAEELSRTLFSSGLARKPLHIYFEGINGVCYIKGAAVGM